MSNIINTPAGGSHILGSPLTTQLSSQASPSLLRNEIDDRIVKIRPMATPIDQISRWAGARNCGSMIVDYYSVDTKPTTAKTTSTYDEIGIAGGYSHQTATIHTSNDEIFEPSETILVPSVPGYKDDGLSPCGSLVLYVVERPSSGGITVMAANGRKIDEVENCIPSIPADTQLVRMGRAATELDVQTPQYEALPTKSRNYCQIFKAQVEQSTMMKIANKEVGWTFNDQEESAIIDMRLGMEKNFLFGHMSRIYDPNKREEVLLTGGIWNQTPRECQYLAGDFSHDTLIEISRMAFTENAGSKRKILIGGSSLIEALNKMEFTKVIAAGDTVTKWGIDFNEINTKFGSLYTLHSEIFDSYGHSADGIIIDPEYLTKYSHVPFRTEALDLKKSGVRNTDAIVITEASCLVLRYPQAHLKIITV